ncbi:hypothetical protein FOMPIDRAFT_1056018 [Fomitopsis schrenkii]|uniref:Uncharacterized protein n=1 Tax=Fomitopsis schrenkii TaxID=2126942 RepID=S8DQC5_FOMSC|nr:hypothetical protein FOMPIDRAFT_1056018 [Fomitopsis schrenkii]
MKSNRQRRVESGQPIELLSEGKYTTIAHSAAPCLLGCQQSGTVTPCTCARIRDVLTGRIVVPLVLPGGDIMMQMAKKYPQGTFAPVIFGIQGVDVHSLADPRTSEVDLVAQGRMPHASDTPFAQYLHMPQFTGVRHITVRINWPDHVRKTKVPWPDRPVVQTAGLVEEDIPLLYREGGKTVHLTASKLMMRVGMIVEKALQDVENFYRGENPPKHRCWGVARDVSRCGILRREVFVKALHHVGGITFQPELQIRLEDDRQQRRFVPPFVDGNGNLKW